MYLKLTVTIALLIVVWLGNLGYCVSFFGQYRIPQHDEFRKLLVTLISSFILTLLVFLVIVAYHPGLGPPLE